MVRFAGDYKNFFSTSTPPPTTSPSLYRPSAIIGRPGLPSTGNSLTKPQLVASFQPLACQSLIVPFGKNSRTGNKPGSCAMQTITLGAASKVCRESTLFWAVAGKLYHESDASEMRRKGVVRGASCCGWHAVKMPQGHGTGRRASRGTEATCVSTLRASRGCQCKTYRVSRQVAACMVSAGIGRHDGRCRRRRRRKCLLSFEPGLTCDLGRAVCTWIS